MNQIFTLNSKRKASAGSALLVTLLVVSLLLVMVLSLVVVVRMELRKAVAHQELMQARANARLGLELAIAKLQIAAGPDTRVTAPVVPSGTVRPNSLHIGQAIDSQPFIQGNSLQLNPRYGQATGYFISDPPSGAFDPNSYWPFLGGTQVSPSSVLMIGPGSVSLEDSNNDGVPDGFVAAPLRPIEIPGSEGNISTGEFSYHIRDNGMQAQINLTDSFRIESEGRLDFREQAITAQRVGSEIILPHFNPDDVAHQDVLGRIILNSQLDLTTFVGEEGARELFHSITLQSLGLPVNVKHGGFRRDLTAVMREAEDNGGLVNNDGPQWNALLAFQESRMQRWRDQTVALEGETRPSGVPRHRWNALKALTLRSEQNDPQGFRSPFAAHLDRYPQLREKVFPPNSDMWLPMDPGGGQLAATHHSRHQKFFSG